ncbi:MULTISPECIES: TIGR04211 family SH3 domain-containing protein [Chromohalobacter]|uniref:TIGR04211 family SH3 domain-containing protein n=1 Tax=Chromohalobacter beijerinckii TaxID=86179 RepID=A0ABV8XCG1_9GAMM|nr:MULTISPECIES: TIGR04211 family SH3 domain-containing protein [Chromohalobacter]MCK0753894.1 TIGR04211 family SH3 domain-containing protein [Chromohalobacter japonicus]MCK0766711.1 TIGR04211 family SH3 domain-containing protein [Chromohalobacter beijerinckii]
MSRIKPLMLSLVLGACAFNAHAQDDGQYWVSDKLPTYVRSGPTEGYRIVGTLESGDPVTLLERQGDYSRVRGDDGDAVWIPSRYLQDSPSASSRLPELQARVDELTSKLDGINEEWEQRVEGMTTKLDNRAERIEELESRNAELDSAYSDAEETTRELKARLDTQEQDLLMRYFTYGAAVAGAGLLVGLIVPHLPRRRKRRSGWF